MLARKDELKKTYASNSKSKIQVDKMHVVKVMRSARTKWLIFTRIATSYQITSFKSLRCGEL